MSQYFHYQQDKLFVENMALADIAERFGTPAYVYSQAALTDAYLQYAEAFKGREHLICFAVKSNPNLSILNLFARLGAGFDIVSGGELQRVLAAGGDAGKVVFSGVGKSGEEMRQALAAGILCFNVESEAELLRLNDVAGSMGKVAPISFRVNPNVDAKTHPYISTGLKQSKFGVAYTDALALYRKAARLPHLRITGIDCHIGSQLTETSPFIAAAEKVLLLVDTLAQEGIRLEHIDLGGGLGICYNDETPPSIAEYAKALLGALNGRTEKLIVEPGRVLVGNAGVLLTRVEYLKPGEEKHFAIVDAAMNDLMRPALYEAYHAIQPLTRRAMPAREYEVVGPVCESGDFLGHARELALEQGDFLALMSAGAYGMSMSSNYNTRPRAAEIMINGAEVKLIREREKVEQLFAGEKNYL
ncbi:MAG: diaminopimelate decarboxylase [Gallionellales bacterium 35-53-114]|jgi:diaminopimelate decarboxylase|nr:MAG: diaminopimelate decarboxylase [Gallionellales bacterium 35-53-114]OYZ63735.1 MAG: diaminopimelate decarboxylase [Gallionellales bacterium 24-53-125]OZB09433.1 MAG: diaminopimelate decarboxylase [Gallionellales bacterium 39-52-133]HQS57908.1 diaminopimelate decarboxylase [Gallionellaceae bacterium]HQS76069.1 diaminopimelate decarboxylase [Gallionellaceae bacterium]